MNLLLRFITGSFFLSAVFLLPSQAYAASTQSLINELNSYEDTMRTFMPVIEDWVDETQAAIESVPAKPELACSDEMTQLGRNGFSMLSDLRGTRVPFDQAPTHTRLMTSVWMIAASAATVCGDDAQHMIETVQEARADLDLVIMELAGPIQLR